jgi:FKBP-type peptidyl-prolyl cis-trans isomerase FkpA
VSARVEYEDLEVGHGAEATAHSIVRIRYDGFLNRGDQFQKDFECSIDLSNREVMAGLRYGVQGMREGGRRRIKVGSHLAYGAQGVEGVIPPNALLIFDVRLLRVTFEQQGHNLPANQSR